MDALQPLPGSLAPPMGPPPPPRGPRSTARPPRVLAIGAIGASSALSSSSSDTGSSSRFETPRSESTSISWGTSYYTPRDAEYDEDGMRVIPSDADTFRLNIGALQAASAAQGAGVGIPRPYSAALSDASARLVAGMSFEDLTEDKISKVYSRCRHNKYREVEDCLNRGFPVDTRNKHGNTLLHICGQNGHKRIAKLVLRWGANINMQNNAGNTVLHFCYAYKYTDLGEYLISKGADPNLRNGNGLTCHQGLGKSAVP
eukprot:tig00000204_g17688.t1